MNNKQDTMWNRMVKRLLPRAMWERPAIDAEANTKRLKRLPVDDPTYQLLLDHALAQFATDLETVLDPAVPEGGRIAAANSAVGLRRLVLELESKRQGWNAEREREEAEEREAAKAGSAARKGRSL